MRQAITHEIHGLKCDAKGCDYEDNDAKFEDYERYLNAPCPKCGANLLTEADLKATKAILAMTDWINKIVGPAEGPEVRMEIKMDGTGVPTIGRVEVSQ